MDPPNRVKKKIMRATTDSGREIVFSKDPEKAGVNNLLTIYEALTKETPESIEAHFEGKGYGDLKKAVVEVVNETLDVIVTGVVSSGKVSITGFGTFEARDRAARTARNPQTGEEIKVAATRVPAFKAGKSLKDTVAGK